MRTIKRLPLPPLLQPTGQALPAKQPVIPSPLPPTSAITANTMTIKSAVTTISVSATPATQTVVAGAQAYAFANVQFDATASGEDIKFSTIPLTFTNGGTASYITGCTLYDGSTALNTGGNTVTLLRSLRLSRLTAT